MFDILTCAIVHRAILLIALKQLVNGKVNFDTDTLILLTVKYDSATKCLGD